MFYLNLVLHRKLEELEAAVFLCRVEARARVIVVVEEASLVTALACGAA